MKEIVQATLFEMLEIDAPSKHEENVATYVAGRLEAIGFEVERDEKGNVVGFLKGKGEPVLLNAHLDRVPPGKGHTPLVENGVAKSDGTTNLGADDAAGLTVILEAARTLAEEDRDYPPLVVAFTVEEEIGLLGAKALDLEKFKVKQGIVYDNAFEAGTVVSRGAAYVAFDVEIQGKSVHPGKELSEGINVVKVYQEVDIPIGETDAGNTRVNIGVLSAGKMRNQVPDRLSVQGEIRSFLDENDLETRIEQIEQAFAVAGEKSGAKVEFSAKKLAVGYEVDESEPLLQTYKEVVAERGGEFKMQETFVASDANALRESGLNVFVVSTGVTGEHSTEEKVSLDDLVQLTADLITLLEKASS